jgi:hypothetical protein
VLAQLHVHMKEGREEEVEGGKEGKKKGREGKEKK